MSIIFLLALNSMTFKHFLWTLFGKLSKKKKYLLVLDNVGYHKTSCIKNFIQEHTNFENIDSMQEALESFWAEHKFMQDFMRYLRP